MATPILATKLFVLPAQTRVVLHPRLTECLNEGLHRKLILISAPAGSGKTMLLGEWVAACERPAAWLSLDEGDNDPARFLMYLVAALQTIEMGARRAYLALMTSHPDRRTYRSHREKPIAKGSKNRPRFAVFRVFSRKRSRSQKGRVR